MRYFLGVDLAARYSGAVLLNEHLGVEGEWVADFGPATKPVKPQPILRLAKHWWRTELALPGSLALDSGGRVGVEDVHPHAINDKPALRVQGAFLSAMDDDEVEAEVIRVLDWQAHFGYKRVKGRTTTGWASALCTEFGYEPPLKGKSNEDLRDGYLIARYLMETE